MVTKEALVEFKELYKEHFKIELSDKEAFEKAINLLNLYRVVYGGKVSKKNDASCLSQPGLL
jgi:hypothetical protein